MFCMCFSYFPHRVNMYIAWFLSPTIFLDPSKLRWSRLCFTNVNAWYRIKQAGGKVVRQHVKSLSELDKKYDAVINCTGLGAKKLVGDYKLVPIRGQVFKVHYNLMVLILFQTSFFIILLIYWIVLLKMRELQELRLWAIVNCSSGDDVSIFIRD